MRLYIAFATLSAPIWHWALRKRVRRGKEDQASIREKLGYASQPRPDGALIWFHALSVGESLALLTLLKKLGEDLPNAHFLLTTGTRTSVAALEKIGLPPRVIHQYVPADARGPVQRFLNHWRPDIVAFAETDLWPYMITRVANRGIPLMLINAQVTNHSFPRRMRTRSIYRHILPMFRRIFTQDQLSSERFLALGADATQIELLGPLKTGADPLPDLPEARKEITTWISGRPVWFAASTHIREEDQLIAAHKAACEKIPALLMIIAPRHINIADQTEALCRAASVSVARRSRGEKITSDTQVYIADTFGEMGLWCRIAPVVFIGHSMPVKSPKLTGKNPHEALALGAYVLHGPDYVDLNTIYRQLVPEGATKTVTSSTELAHEIISTISDPSYSAPYKAAAKRCLAEGSKALIQTQKVLRSMIEQG